MGARAGHARRPGQVAARDRQRLRGRLWPRAPGAPGGREVEGHLGHDHDAHPLPAGRDAAREQGHARGRAVRAACARLRRTLKGREARAQLFFAGSLPISLSTWTRLSTRKASVPRAIDSSVTFSTRLFTTPVRVMFPFSTTMWTGGLERLAKRSKRPRP